MVKCPYIYDFSIMGKLSIKKDLKKFLMSEEGKIVEKDAVKLGMVLAAAAGVLGGIMAPKEAFMDHDNWMMGNCGNKSLPACGEALKNTPCATHSSHGSHGSGGWCG